MGEMVLFAIPVAALAGITLAAMAPRYLLPTLIVAGILLSPPSIVGERFPYVGPVVIIVGAVIALLRNRPTERTPIAPFLLLGLAGIWLLAHEAIRPGSEPGLMGNITVGLVPAIAFALVVRDRELLDLVIRVIVGSVVIIASLSVAAVLLGLVTGFPALFVGSVALGYDRLETGILLPGAFMYGDNLTDFPRLVGIGREPGMGAIFYAFAFFALPADWKRRVLTRAVLIGALLTTQSTAGIGVFGVCWALYYVFGRARFRPLVATATAVFGAVIVWLAIYSPEFGIIAKSQESVSVDERTASTFRGLSALTTNFFDAATTLPLSNVNLIASIASHGAPWAILLISLLLIAVFIGGRTSPYSYFSLFLFVTMLTSQPIAGTPGILILAIIAIAAGAREKTPSDHPEAGSQRGSTTALGRQYEPLVDRAGRVAPERHTYP